MKKGSLRTVIYKRGVRYYFLCGKICADGKYIVLDFPFKQNVVPTKEWNNNPEKLLSSVDIKNRKFVGIYETEEEAYDQMDYYLEFTLILSDSVRTAYADT